jgi:tetratricopeptide (TPR) repeat protein
MMMVSCRSLACAALGATLAILAPGVQAQESDARPDAGQVAAVDAAVARLGETMRKADGLEKQGRLAQAEPVWRDALDQRRKLLGDRDPLVAEAMKRLARNIETQGDYKRAEPIRRSILALLQADGASAMNLPEAHSALGYNLTVQGNLHEGAAQSYKALEILRAAGKGEAPEAAHALSVVGLTLDKQGLYAKAEPFYRRALDIRRKVLGENDLDTATSYSNLAVALSGQGRFGEAQGLFETALAIREADGTVPDQVALNALNIALNLDSQGQSGKAKMMYEIAITMWTKLYGAEHVTTASGYNGLGMNYYRQDMFSMAAVQLKHALKLREAALGRYNPDTAESYGNVGMVERAMGHEKEGKALIATAVEIDERTLGKDHPSTQALREALAAAPPVSRPEPTVVGY